jgi:hypothetical protein
VGARLLPFRREMNDVLRVDNLDEVWVVVSFVDHEAADRQQCVVEVFDLDTLEQAEVRTRLSFAFKHFNWLDF